MKRRKDLRIYTIVLLLSNCMFVFLAGLLANFNSHLERHVFSNYYDKWERLSVFAGITILIMMLLLSVLGIFMIRKDRILIMLISLSPIAILFIVSHLI